MIHMHYNIYRFWHMMLHNIIVQSTLSQKFQPPRLGCKDLQIAMCLDDVTPFHGDHSLSLHCLHAADYRIEHILYENISLKHRKSL